MIIENILNYISFFIVLVSLIVAVVKVFDKDLYIEYIVWIFAIGCYMLEEVVNTVEAICNNGSYSDVVDISLFAMFGCFCFFLTGSLGCDEMSDKISFRSFKFKPRKKHLLLLAYELVILAMMMHIIIIAINVNRLSEAIIILIAYSPIIPTAYFTLLNLISPDSEFKKFKYTRYTNIFVLQFLLYNMLYVCFVASEMYIFSDISDVLISLSIVGIVYNSIKGKKAWKS